MWAISLVTPPTVSTFIFLFYLREINKLVYQNEDQKKKKKIFFFNKLSYDMYQILVPGKLDVESFATSRDNRHRSICMHVIRFEACPCGGVDTSRLIKRRPRGLTSPITSAYGIGDLNLPGA